MKEFTLHLTGNSGGDKGKSIVLGWSFNNYEEAARRLEGRDSTTGEGTGLPPLLASRDIPPLPFLPPHENGVYEIDHIVLQTGDWDQTKASFAAMGMELKREIVNDKRQLRQSFYRPSQTIIEVLSSTKKQVREGVEEAAGGGSTRDSSSICKIWGITFSCSDIDQTHALLLACTKPPYPALQAGRRMTVLDTSSSSRTSMPLRVAFMSPHVGSDK